MVAFDLPLILQSNDWQSCDKFFKSLPPFNTIYIFSVLNWVCTIMLLPPEAVIFCSWGSVIYTLRMLLLRDLNISENRNTLSLDTYRVSFFTSIRRYFIDTLLASMATMKFLPYVNTASHPFHHKYRHIKVFEVYLHQQTNNELNSLLCYTLQRLFPCFSPLHFWQDAPCIPKINRTR